MREISAKIGDSIRVGKGVRVTILGFEGTETIVGIQDLNGNLDVQQEEKPYDYRYEPVSPLLSGKVINGK